MADNVTLPGTGVAVAADEVNGTQYQRVKTCFGEDGTASDVCENSPLPVDIQGLYVMLERLISAMAYPPWLDRSANAIRIQVQSGTVSAVTTVTTVTTVTNMSQVDTYQGKLLMIGTNVNVWANTVRRTIS